MLTKEYIKELKNNGNGAIGKLVGEHKNNIGSLVFILESLGQLPKNFDGSFLADLTNHKSSDVRTITFLYFKTRQRHNCKT